MRNQELFLMRNQEYMKKDFSFKILPMEEKHRSEVVKMMRVFFSSPAVLSDGNDEIFNSDVSACVSDMPFIEGYVFESESGEIAGYSMLSMGFSTESGKRRVWIEDLFIKEAFRGKGIGGHFLDFISEKYSGFVLRLEVEEENISAVELYKKHGFEFLAYSEMIKE
jgi:ribosomal protein S18 acetylase RimI-like enzyme